MTTTLVQIQILADALVATGLRLWSTSLNNTPAARRVYTWMKNITPGHFVLEMTSLRSGPAMDRVGELLAIENNGAFFMIRTVDGRELRWENAEFVRIPRDQAENREILQLGTT